jgi:hypothetical protein
VDLDIASPQLVADQAIELLLRGHEVRQVLRPLLRGAADPSRLDGQRGAPTGDFPELGLIGLDVLESTHYPSASPRPVWLATVVLKLLSARDGRDPCAVAWQMPRYR